MPLVIAADQCNIVHPLLLQLVSLQSKWIGEILPKSFGAPAKLWQTSQDGLAAFLPEDFRADEAVLSAALSKVVQLVQQLIHRTNMKQNMEQLSIVLDPATMGAVCKPLIKLPGLTGFKKLKQACHESLAAQCLDEEAAAKAAEVVQGARDLQGSLDQSFEDVDSLRLDALTQLVSTTVNLQTEVSKLPTGADSAHKSARDEAEAVIKAALDLYGSLSSDALSWKKNVFGNFGLPWLT